MFVIRLISMIVAEISAYQLQLKRMGSYFFGAIPSPYIESTTVLSDIYRSLLRVDYYSISCYYCTTLLHSI